MLIANPIYDVVFKRMMENEKVAKFFIGTLLEQTIESVEVKPQEFTYTNESAGLAVFRLDFIATIKTETGEHKKVLIEIQKAKNRIDLMRFRNYLGEQYKKEEAAAGAKAPLPITTVYILGFTLPEIESACIKVERQYKDLINKTVIETKCEFVEKLTHDSFIVQVERITDRFQTRLDKLLSVFEQRHFTDDTKVVKRYNHQPDTEEVKTLTGILHHAGTDPEERKQIEREQEAWRSVYALFGDDRKKLEKTLQDLEEVQKKISEQDKLIEELKRRLGEK